MCSLVLIFFNFFCFSFGDLALFFVLLVFSDKKKNLKNRTRATPPPLRSTILSVVRTVLYAFGLACIFQALLFSYDFLSFYVSRIPYFGSADPSDPSPEMAISYKCGTHSFDRSIN